MQGSGPNCLPGHPVLPVLPMASPPLTDTFMVITFAGALRQASAYCVHLKAELFSCADGTLSAAAGL